jgi:hypothetical protein
MSCKTRSFPTLQFTFAPTFVTTSVVVVFSHDDAPIFTRSVLEKFHVVLVVANTPPADISTSEIGFAQFQVDPPSVKELAAETIIVVCVAHVSVAPPKIAIE